MVDAEIGTPSRYLGPSRKKVVVIMGRRDFRLTAFTSPKLPLPLRAKWPDRLALVAPAHTPHSARNALDPASTATLIEAGNAGDRQSRTMAVSLKTSAARRYILHSGSSAVPSL